MNTKNKEVFFLLFRFVTFMDVHMIAAPFLISVLTGIISLDRNRRVNYLLNKATLLNENHVNATISK